MRRNGRRGGFSLPEMLVVMGQIALLSAVAAPTVFSQIHKAERHRLVGDLQGVTQAAELFKVDVGRWPGSVAQLMEPIGPADEDLAGRPYTSREASRWAGPYLVRAGAWEAGSGSARDARPRPQLSATRWKGDTYLRLTLSGVDRETARWVSQEVEGDTLVGDEGAGEGVGAVRWKDGPVDSLVYLVRPLR